MPSGRRPEGGSSRKERSSLGTQLPRPPSRSSKPLVVIETERWGGRQDGVSAQPRDPSPTAQPLQCSAIHQHHKRLSRDSERLMARSRSHSNKSKGPHREPCSQGWRMFSEAINYFYPVSKASRMGESGSIATPQAFAPRNPPLALTVSLTWGWGGAAEAPSSGQPSALTVRTRAVRASPPPLP